MRGLPRRFLHRLPAMLRSSAPAPARIVLAAVQSRTYSVRNNTGNNNTDEAKIIGITPDWLTLSGM